MILTAVMLNTGWGQNSSCELCDKISPELEADITSSVGAHALTDDNMIPFPVAAGTQFILTDDLMKSLKPLPSSAYGQSLVDGLLSEANLARIYPSPKIADQYDELIVKYAAEKNLDPKLLKAWIATESGFNRKAYSSAGARGLMQLMPGTARMMANRLRIKYSLKKLYEAEYNIRLGVEYVVYLTEIASAELMDGVLLNTMDLPQWVLQRVIASYNAGPLVMTKGKVPSDVRGYVAKVVSFWNSQLVTITDI